MDEADTELFVEIKRLPAEARVTMQRTIRHINDAIDRAREEGRQQGREEARQRLAEIFGPALKAGALDAPDRPSSSAPAVSSARAVKRRVA